jgi:cell division septal protein FtsQ
MATRKRTTTRKTGATAKNSRRTNVNRKNNPGRFANFFVPLFFIVGILLCLGFVSLIGYRTVTASAFFDVKTVDIRGVTRASREDIERIVSRQAEKPGVWNADLMEIKNNVEKLTFVKSAVVSRVLPDGLRVSVKERVPRVVVHLEAGDFWVDEEAVILEAVDKNDAARQPFVLRGWDESKADKAAKENQDRVKMYLKMLDEWQDYDLVKRVSAVNLTNLREAQAVVQDSGENVAIILGNDNFGSRLKSGLEKIAGRGKEIKSIDVSNVQGILGFREKETPKSGS